MKNHVSVRLDAEAITRVDALISRLQIEGRTATRSDVLRALVLRALGAAERDRNEFPDRITGGSATATGPDPT